MLGTGFDATFSDNCPGATIANDFNGGSSLAGETFPKGVATVAWTATDASGATAMCSVDITITDGESPTITCPADLEVEPTSTIGALVTYDAPVVGDNCPGATYACAPASGSQFGFGDTVVTCAATDDSGNQESCMFTVTVLEAAGVIDNVIDAINDLHNAGALNGGQTNALLKKLLHVLNAIDEVKDNVACNVLQAFINHVTDLIATGVLTEAEGLPLIASAENARAALGCPAPPKFRNYQTELPGSQIETEMSR